MYISNKMHMLQSLFYLTTALHVSGVTITHLQEHKTTVTTASGNRYTVLLSAAILEELELIWVCCGWRMPPTTHSAVLGSWWWAVCRPKRVELHINWNNKISDTLLHLVGFFFTKCFDVHKIMIPGNPLVSEVPDIATFTVFTVLRPSLVMGVSFIQCTGYQNECMMRVFFPQMFCLWNFNGFQ